MFLYAATAAGALRRVSENVAEISIERLRCDKGMNGTVKSIDLANYRRLVSMC